MSKSLSIKDYCRFAGKDTKSLRLKFYYISILYFPVYIYIYPTYLQ